MKRCNSAWASWILWCPCLRWNRPWPRSLLEARWDNCWSRRSWFCWDKNCCFRYIIKGWTSRPTFEKTRCCQEDSSASLYILLWKLPDLLCLFHCGWPSSQYSLQDPSWSNWKTGTSWHPCYLLVWWQLFSQSELLADNTGLTINQSIHWRSFVGLSKLATHIEDYKKCSGE